MAFFFLKKKEFAYHCSWSKQNHLAKQLHILINCKQTPIHFFLYILLIYIYIYIYTMYFCIPNNVVIFNINMQMPNKCTCIYVARILHKYIIYVCEVKWGKNAGESDDSTQ